VIGVILTPLAILANEYLLDAAAWQAAVPAVIINGLLPTLLVVAAVTAFYLLLKMKVGATRNEAFQAIFVLLLSAFLVLTATGVWFRGEGMTLTWLG
jgi:hypothetical protein